MQDRAGLTLLRQLYFACGCWFFWGLIQAPSAVQLSKILTCEPISSLSLSHIFCVLQLMGEGLQLQWCGHQEAKFIGRHLPDCLL